MAEYVTREEFEARVGVLEQEVDGEKLVTRHILEQTRRNGDDIAAMKTQLGRVETRLDGVETRLGGVEKRLGGVETRLGGVETRLGGVEKRIDGVEKRVGTLTSAVQDLKKELPAIVSKAMREVLGDQKA